MFKSAEVLAFVSWFSVNYQDDHRHSGEDTGHVLPPFGHPANKIIFLY